MVVTHGIRIAAAVLLSSLIAASPAAAQRAERPHQQKTYTFDLIPGITTNPFYVTLFRGAKDEARVLGVKLVSLGAPDAFSASAQTPYVDLAIAQHPDAILIAPTDETAMVAPLRRAVRAGIPVITVDTSISAPFALTHIGSRNVQGGALAARALVQAIHGRGAVLSISVRPGISTTDRRERGFVRELGRYRNTRYLGTFYDDDVVSRAVHITIKQLARHSTVAGIFALNALSGVGAIGGVTAAHKARQVRLVEFGAEPLQVYTLRQGIVDALIAEDPLAMGNLGIRLAYRWATGHRTGITKDYFTREIVLTRANVDNPRFKRFLYAGH
ncbi:MAG: ABC transporter substrate-binding protein [Chloroflexota bacterium]